jgi:hypothetical protein
VVTTSSITLLIQLIRTIISSPTAHRSRSYSQQPWTSQSEADIPYCYGIFVESVVTSRTFHFVSSTSFDHLRNIRNKQCNESEPFSYLFILSCEVLTMFFCWSRTQHHCLGLTADVYLNPNCLRFSGCLHITHVLRLVYPGALDPIGGDTAKDAHVEVGPFILMCPCRL